MWIRQNCHLLYKRSRKAVFQYRYVEDLRSGIPILCLVSVIYFWGNNVVLNADKLTTIKYSLVPTYYTAPGLCHNPYVYLTSPYFEGKHFNHMTQRLVVLLTVHHFKVFSSILTWVFGETPEPMQCWWCHKIRVPLFVKFELQIHPENSLLWGSDLWSFTQKACLNISQCSSYSF